MPARMQASGHTQQARRAAAGGGAHDFDALEEAAPKALAAVVVRRCKEGHLQVAVAGAHRRGAQRLAALEQQLRLGRQRAAEVRPGGGRRVVVDPLRGVLRPEAAEEDDGAEAPKVEVLRVLRAPWLLCKL